MIHFVSFNITANPGYGILTYLQHSVYRRYLTYHLVVIIMKTSFQLYIMIILRDIITQTKTSRALGRVPVDSTGLVPGFSIDMYQEAGEKNTHYIVACLHYQLQQLDIKHRIGLLHTFH